MNELPYTADEMAHTLARSVHRGGLEAPPRTTRSAVQPPGEADPPGDVHAGQR
ncbi:hypothetical protein AB0953_07015 [Streptomyces sp. NPDC046866]|uniref:hypothetical protein n=1 Tax=Streptomyces sp. NPDC046866 TaxID=3154921 RepID=UPI00345447CF